MITQKPWFGAIQKKLSVVVKAYFNQRDLTKMEIVKELYESLNSSITQQLADPVDRVSSYYVGTCLREMVMKFRNRLLLIFKALMLEKKVIIIGLPCKKLSQYIHSLLSLFPGYLERLDEIPCRTTTATCGIKEYSMEHAKNQKSAFGFPLQIYMVCSVLQSVSSSLTMM